MFYNIIGTDDFGRCCNFYPIPQPGTAQAIIDKHKRIAQRRAQMLGKLHWCGPRATFRTIYCHKINALARLDHGFHNCNKFPWMTYT